MSASNVVALPEMKTYSFRAECKFDVETFKATMRKQNVSLKTVKLVHDDDNLPDVQYEFTSIENIGIIQDILRTIVDGHVMLQTLRECPLSENSLVRDYALE